MDVEHRAAAIAFFAADMRLAVIDDGAVRVWNTASWVEQPRLARTGMVALAASPDGLRLAAVGPAGGRIWDIDGRELSAFTSQSDLEAVTFVGDSERLATVARGQVTLWDVNTGVEVLTLRDTGSHARVVAFDPTGRLLVTGNDDGSITAYDSQASRGAP